MHRDQQSEGGALLVRACCPAGAAVGKGFVDTVDVPHYKNYLLTGEPAPIVRSISEADPRPYRFAAHEAGHASIYHLLGVSIDVISIERQPHVRGSERARTLTGAENVAISLAGPITDQWLQKEKVEPYSEQELNGFLAQIEEFNFGRCDECKACLASRVAARAPGAPAADVFRAGEQLATRLVTRPDTWEAITALAREVWWEYRVDGPRAHEILSQYIEFGSEALSPEQGDQPSPPGD